MIINCRVISTYFETPAFEWIVTCNGNVSIVDQGTPVIRVNKDDGTPNDKIKALMIKKPLERFPADIEKFFPNLEVLYFITGNIKSLTVDDLKVFPKLRVLDLGGQKLTYLQGDLLNFNPKLQMISFGANNIEVIERGLLAGLTDLKLAYFNKNPCINLMANRTDMAVFSRQLATSCPMSRCLPAPTKLF
jgi:hypothetical protein